MEHMADIGMCFEARPCHFLSKVGNANLRSERVSACRTDA